MNPKVSIIILNWNGWKDTIECLESLYQIIYSNYDVIVVDNGSEDESIEKIKEYVKGKIKVESKFFKYDPHNKPIKIIEYTREETEAGGGKEKKITNLPSNRKLLIIKNEKNYGFAEGNNIAIKYALKDTETRYIVTLNNDMVVTRNWLMELMREIDRDGKIGSCSSKILFYSRENIINSTGVLILKDGAAIDRGRNEEDKGQYERIEEVFGACAGAAIYRREALEEVGVFDKEYFAYYEDVDLAWKLRLAGWKCMYVPKAVVSHKYSISGGAFSLFKVYQGERNRIWNVIKNFPLEYVLLAPFYNIAKNILLLYATIKGEGRGTLYSRKHSLHKIVITMLRAQTDALVKLPQMLTKRRAVKRLHKIKKAELRQWFKKYSLCLKEVPYR